MGFERTWPEVEPIALIVNGGEWGKVVVSDVAGFRVKQSAYLTANGLPDLPVQVKIVLSPTTLIVGFVDNQIANWKPINISAYTVANNAMIGAQWQDKNKIGVDDISKAVYEADPTVAIRTIDVDQYGDFYTENNPLPVSIDSTISVGEVEIKGSPSGNLLDVNADGSINVVVESTSGGTVVNTYNEVSVASRSTLQIVTYTIPVGKTALLQRSAVSGDNIGRYDLFINGVVQDTARTMFGGDLTQMFDFTDGIGSGLPLNAGDVVTVQVNNPRPTAANYNARVQVVVYT